MSTEQELWWPKINGKEGKKAYLDLTCAASASVAAASFHAHNITNKQYPDLCVAFIKAWPSDHPGEHETQTRLVTENDNLFTARSSTQSMDHDQNSQEQEEQAAEEEEVSHSVGHKNKNLTAALSTSESNNMSS